MEPHSYNRLKQLLSDYLSNGDQVNASQLTECLGVVTASEKYELITRLRNRIGNSVIHVAAFGNHADIIKCVLESFAPEARCELLKLENGGSANAMHWAAMNGHTASIASMLDMVSAEERFQLMKIQTKVGKTTMHFASVRGHTNAIRKMLYSVTAEERNELLKLQDDWGRTAIHWAAVRGSNAALRCMLDSVSADEKLFLLGIHSRDNLYTALDEAMKYQQHKTVNILSGYIAVPVEQVSVETVIRPERTVPDGHIIEVQTVPEEKLDDLACKLEQHAELIQQKEKQITDLQGTVLELTVKLEESRKLKDEEISQLKSQLEANQSEISKLKNQHEMNVQQERVQLADLAARLEKQQEAIEWKDKQIRALQDTVNELINRLVGQEALIKENAGHVSDKADELKQKIRDNVDEIDKLKDKMENGKNKTDAEPPTDSYTDAVMEEQRPATPSGEEVADESADSGIQEATT